MGLVHSGTELRMSHAGRRNGHTANGNGHELEPASCVLLSDGGAESQEIRQLLRKHRVRFSEVSTAMPGRQGIKAPRLYTAIGPLHTVGLIRSWIMRQAAKSK
jgi:hypothetical protein